MAKDKKYFWLKLKKQMFDDNEAMDFLLSQKNGSEYAMIYILLCLRTMNTDGELASHIGEMIIPYTPEKIERDLKYFALDTIMVALDLYKQLGLVYESLNGSLVISNYEELIGSETKWAEYKRIQRKKELEIVKNKSNESPIRDKSIEYRDKSIEKDIDREIPNSSSKEDSLFISCGETSEKVSPPNEKAPEQEAIFLFMPLRTVDENGNSEEVGIPVSWVESMKNLYPDLDVEGEVRKAVAWCLNNPKARKTSAGWQRYLNAWLTRAVDKKSQFPNFEEQKELKRKQEREESIRRGEELERIYGKTLRL